MDCPVCGKDCVNSAHEMIEKLPTVFKGCTECIISPHPKRVPPPRRFYKVPCSCGKRFIDEVFVHLWVILVEEQIFCGSEPLGAVGQPLVHPGFVMGLPPFLPKDSLVLLSPHPTEAVARRMVEEVPEVRGVVKQEPYVPGIIDPGLQKTPREYPLLAGCDVRADVFGTAMGPIVVYKQQSTIHLEFPRGNDPKISEVEARISATNPHCFVDASCGAGTLGLVAARNAVRSVVMNDAWYSAAFWAAFNIGVNREYFLVNDVIMHHSLTEMKAQPVGQRPVLVGEARGDQEITVYHGDLFRLNEVIGGSSVLATLDLFDKSDKGRMAHAIERWKGLVSGEVFIP